MWAWQECEATLSCAGFHRPFYTDSVYGNSDTGDVGFTEEIRNALERLFFQFQVPPARLGSTWCHTCGLPELLDTLPL